MLGDQLNDRLVFQVLVFNVFLATSKICQILAPVYLGSQILFCNNFTVFHFNENFANSSRDIWGWAMIQFGIEVWIIELSIAFF